MARSKPGHGEQREPQAAVAVSGAGGVAAALSAVITVSLSVIAGSSVSSHGFSTAPMIADTVRVSSLPRVLRDLDGLRGVLACTVGVFQFLPVVYIMPGVKLSAEDPTTTSF